MLWGCQFNFFLLSYSCFAGSFCLSSHLFHVLSGLQGDSFTQLAELGCSLMYRMIKDALCSLPFAVPAMGVPSCSSVSNSASAVTQRSFLHMGTRDARRTPGERAGETPPFQPISWHESGSYLKIPVRPSRESVISHSTRLQ